MEKRAARKSTNINYRQMDKVGFVPDFAAGEESDGISGIDASA